MIVNGQYYDDAELEEHWISKPDDFRIFGDTNHHRKSRDRKAARAPEQKQEKIMNMDNINILKVWGIGLDAETAVMMDPATWLGQGLLGRVLVHVREELKKTE